MRYWTDPDGTIHLEGGWADVDTTGPEKRITILPSPPSGGPPSKDWESVGLHFCDGCGSWLNMVEGKPIHTDEQVVKCVLQS